MTHPFRFGVQASEPTDGPGWAEMAGKIESLGYSVLSMADHFDRPLSPFPALAAAAAATTTLRLATIVICNDFRHPVVLGYDAGTVDLLSGGRLELGIGAGWMHTDYEPTGIPFDSAGTRIRRMEEAVAVLKGWFTGESFSHQGDFYTIADLTGTPSAQRPHPPIMMGGGRPRMLRTAARCADIIGLNPSLHAGVINEEAGPSATIERTHEKIGWIRDEAGDRFDAIELQCRVHVASVTDDPMSVANIMGPALGLSAEQALASPHALLGSVAQITEKLHRLREELGISYFTISSDSAEAFAPVAAGLA